MSETASKDGPSWSGVLTILTITAIQGGAVYIIFELYRRTSRSKSAYETRRITRPERSPPEANTALLGWVSSVLAVSDEETHRCVGLDTFMFIRFLRMCFFITGVSSAFALVFLVPIYATGGEPSSASTGYNSINMANVINGSHRLWATLVFWYGFVALVLHCFWREWIVYLPLRQRYLVEGDVDTPQEYRYTLQVESIPMMERKPERLYRYFDELFPGGVVKVNLCLNTEELEATLAAQHAARNAYEAAVAVREASGGSVQPQKRLGGFLCCGGRKVDAIPYYEKEMARLTAEAEAAHAELACFSQELAESDTAQLTRAMRKGISIKGGVDLGMEVVGIHAKFHSIDGEPRELALARRWRHVTSATAFVTLNSLVAKQAAVQCEVSGDAFAFATRPAPEPHDVIWANVTMPAAMQRNKRMLANCLWAAGVGFWTIPVAFAQTISNLDELKKLAPWLWTPAPGTVFYEILSSYLPVIALMLLMMLVPWAITKSAVSFMRLKSASAVDLYVFKWHFGFQLANLWLVLIGGSIFEQFGALKKNPASAVTTVASSIPGSSQFFLNMVITSTYAGLFMELSRVVTIAVNALLGGFFSDKKKSQRMLNARSDPPSFDWGGTFPPIIFILLVGLVYVCIVPIIQPFCAVFFGLAYVIYKHQALHVYAQPAEGGAAYFPLLYTLMMSCLYTAEVVMMVYFGIKEGTRQTPMAFVVIVVTALYDTHLRRNLARVGKTLPLRAARAADVTAAANAAAANGAAAPDELTKDLESVPLRSRIGSHDIFAEMIDSQEYAQPSLRRATWETDPLPYRTSTAQHVNTAQQSARGGSGGSGGLAV